MPSRAHEDRERSSTSGVLFRESRYASPGLRVAVAGLGVAVAASFLVSAVPDAESAGDLVLFAAIGGAVVVLMTAIAAMRSYVLVQAGGLRLTFALGGVTVWRRELAGREISRVGTTAVGALAAGGLGLRYLGPRRWALLVRSGVTVAVTCADGWEYVVATDRPGDLLAALAHLRESGR